jgi:FkbM family methyltransferase
MIRKLVKNLPFLDTVRDTPLGLIIGRFLKIRSALSYQTKLHNFRDLFDLLSVKLVFDVGANIGETTSIYVAAGCKVLAIEPDPDNFRRLAARFRFNNDVNVVRCGVGSSVGVLLLNCYASTAAHDTFSEKRKCQIESPENSPLGAPMAPTHHSQVQITTLDTLIEQYGIPDYVKIDVEGFEWEVLRGLSCPIKAVSFECILPMFLEETIGCLTHLGSLSPRYQYNFWSLEHDYSLQSQRWLSQDEMLELIRKASFPFMEIIAIES